MDGDKVSPEGEMASPGVTLLVPNPEQGVRGRYDCRRIAEMRDAVARAFESYLGVYSPLPLRRSSEGRRR